MISFILTAKRLLEAILVAVKDKVFISLFTTLLIVNLSGVLFYTKLEGVVKDAIEDAFVNDKDKVTTDDILKMISQTHSLSEIMKEPLEKMKKEYKDRKFKNASK